MLLTLKDFYSAFNQDEVSAVCLTVSSLSLHSNAVVVVGGFGGVPQEPGKQLRATLAAFLLFHHREAPGGDGGQRGGEAAAALQALLSSGRLPPPSGDSLSRDHRLRPQRRTEVWRLLP